MIGISELRPTLDALAKLDLLPVQADALRGQAERIAEIVRNSLSHLPGSDHAVPWRRTGTLQESIEAQASEDDAVIGSNEEVAVFQENGTSRIPPRPFLAPAAAANAEQAAREISDAVLHAVREALR